MTQCILVKWLTEQELHFLIHFRAEKLHAFISYMYSFSLIWFDFFAENITAFIPSNRAFARLPKSYILYFLHHKDRLKALLKYHVIKGTFALKDLVDDATHETLLHNLTSRYDTYSHESSNYTVSNRDFKNQDTKKDYC